MQNNNHTNEITFRIYEIYKGFDRALRMIDLEEIGKRATASPLESLGSKIEALELSLKNKKIQYEDVKLEKKKSQELELFKKVCSIYSIKLNDSWQFSILNKLTQKGIQITVPVAQLRRDWQIAMFENTKPFSLEINKSENVAKWLWNRIGCICQYKDFIDEVKNNA